MPHVSYIANGFCKNASAPQDMAGMCELRFWNPLPQATRLRMRVYYFDRSPVDLPEYNIGPETNPLLAFPGDYPEQFTDCGPWGMKLISDSLLLGDHILFARHEGPPENVMYRGGVGDTLLKTRLSRVWYFADGIRLKWDPAEAPWPFSEYEWYHILNPNPLAAHVTVQMVFGPGSYRQEHRTVDAERVEMYDNFDMAVDSPATCYGIRFLSDQPIVVESERVIYGLHGREEWGAYIHCQRPGLPGPLDWNEDGAPIAGAEV